MIRRLHRPPDGQLGGRGRQRTTLMAAGQDVEAFMHVPYCLLQTGREGLALFHCKHVMQGLAPGGTRVGPSPRGELCSQRPHGQRQPGAPDLFFSKFEELSVAERGVVLLLVNPMLSEEPLDQALRMALCDHADGAKRSMQAGYFA